MVCQATIDHAPRTTNLLPIVKRADQLRCTECGASLVGTTCPNCGVSF